MDQEGAGVSESDGDSHFFVRKSGREDEGREVWRGKGKEGEQRGGKGRRQGGRGKGKEAKRREGGIF